MAIHDIINGEAGVNFAKKLAKILPEKTGFRIANSLSHLIVNRSDAELVRSVRANQWVVSDKKLTAEQLNEQVLRVFEHTAYCLFDLYHNVEDKQKLLSKVKFTPKLQETLEKRSACGEGTVFVTPHLSNFDLAGRAVAYAGHDILVLSYPNPNKGYQMQNKMRKDYDVNIVPMSVESLRLSKKRLLEGKMILTGVDRPLAKSNYNPMFFGYPSMLPVTYIKLALQTNSQVIILVSYGNEDGTYTVDASDPIKMKKYDDPVQELERNAETVLKEAEIYIRKYAYQWAMFYPVWPWALDEMPQ